VTFEGWLTVDCLTPVTVWVAFRLIGSRYGWRELGIDAERFVDVSGRVKKEKLALGDLESGIRNQESKLLMSCSLIR
jgi:hypothetical protein